MDLEKFIIFFKAVGFPAAIAVWFLWKIQTFMDTLVHSSAVQIELLRQLIMLHNK